MSDKIVCPTCFAPGKARSQSVAPTGREAWICENNHDFVWPHGTRPASGDPRGVPAELSFQLGSLGYLCKVDGSCNFVVYLDGKAVTEVGQGQLMKKADGRWYIASRSGQIGDPMASQIEQHMNGSVVGAT